MRYITLILSLMLFSCASKVPPLQTVEKVDLNRYMGRWYEIASYDHKFQKGCECTYAEYTLTDKGYVEVKNSCRKGSSKDSPLSQITGKAFVVKNSNNTKLKVQFFWPFKGAYWIIGLDPEYQWVVVSHPNRKYLWVLSRTKKMNDETYEEILKIIKGQHLDVSKFYKRVQE